MASPGYRDLAAQARSARVSTRRPDASLRATLRSCSDIASRLRRHPLALFGQSGSARRPARFGLAQRRALGSVRIGWPRKGARVMTTETDATLALVRRFGELCNRHDVDAMMADMTDDAVYRTSDRRKRAGVGRARPRCARSSKRCSNSSPIVASTRTTSSRPESCSYSWTLRWAEADGSEGAAHGTEGLHRARREDRLQEDVRVARASLDRAIRTGLSRSRIPPKATCSGSLATSREAPESQGSRRHSGPSPPPQSILRLPRTPPRCSRASQPSPTPCTTPRSYSSARCSRPSASRSSATSPAGGSRSPPPSPRRSPTLSRTRKTSRRRFSSVAQRT